MKKRQTNRHTEKELCLSKLYSWTEKSQDPGTSEYYYIQLNRGWGWGLMDTDKQAEFMVCS